MEFKRPDEADKPLINRICNYLHEAIELSKEYNDVNYCISIMNDLLTQLTKVMTEEEYERFIHENLNLGSCEPFPKK